jgi:hypothetical protein
VEMTIKTGKESKKLTMSFGGVETVQVSDRVILWISPVEAGEGLGVKIKLNSLVLNPLIGTAQSSPAQAASGGSPGSSAPSPSRSR